MWWPRYGPPKERMPLINLVHYCFFTLLYDIATMKVECIWLGMARDKSGWSMAIEKEEEDGLVNLWRTYQVRWVDQHEQAALDRYAAIHHNKLVDGLIAEATYKTL